MPLYIAGGVAGSLLVAYGAAVVYLVIVSTAAGSASRRADARATLALLWPPPLPSHWTHRRAAALQPDQPPVARQDVGK